MNKSNEGKISITYNIHLDEVIQCSHCGNYPSLTENEEYGKIIYCKNCFFNKVIGTDLQKMIKEWNKNNQSDEINESHLN